MAHSSFRWPFIFCRNSRGSPIYVGSTHQRMPWRPRKGALSLAAVGAGVAGEGGGGVVRSKVAGVLIYIYIYIYVVAVVTALSY